MIDLKLLPHRKDTNDTVPPIDRKVGYWKHDVSGNRKEFRTLKCSSKELMKQISQNSMMYADMKELIHLGFFCVKRI